MDKWLGQYILTQPAALAGRPWGRIMVAQAKPKALVIGNFRGRSEIIESLRGTAFAVIEATESRRGLKHVLEYAPSVIIICANRPEAAARNLLRALRCLTSAPILLVGSGRETDGALALGHGADAFVPHSRRLEAAPLYINALLSRN